MIDGVYKIADTVFRMETIYEDVHRLCKDYRWDAPSEFTISISPEDIAFEHEKSACEERHEGIPTRHFSDGYLETLAVYRKLCETLLSKGVLLFHGSVVAVDGESYLFTAKSGTGKSTHTKLWRTYFGDRAVMINDDKPLIQITDAGVVVYGAPWDGKHHISTNTSAPLKAICILNRGTENEIRKVTKTAAYPMLLQQTHKPADMQKMRMVLELIDRMCEKISLYSLKCNMNIDAAETAYLGMQE
ncbi:MAG: hypothetical protein MJ071_07135 [Oscillospiraceae bacterium]|nr:hypothetical protein [Oscillospiraceae bacterium]